MSQGPRVVFLHGWCGHGDEARHLKPALPGPLLAPSWMPAPGSIDLAAWPLAEGPAMAAAMAKVADRIHQHVRSTILEAGFQGALLIGHSMGGAWPVCWLLTQRLQLGGWCCWIPACRCPRNAGPTPSSAWAAG
jgi:pimeloyl-ACP methyl ester carboxylesterase